MIYGHGSRLTRQLLNFFLKQGLDKTYWIGYSGGLDSHVLLHIAASFRKEHSLKIKAIHIHHGLSVHADQWALHCEKICHDLKIEWLQKKISDRFLNKKNIEDRARQARYALFSELLDENDFLLTAHQQDDQAETVLLQLLRGSGPKGLAAMPEIKPLGKGFHARPLLNCTRLDLKKYAEEHQLHWIDDESNSNIHFARNYLRHEVIPILKKYWPSLSHTLTRVAKNCAETQLLLEDMAKEDLSCVQGSKLKTISISKLKKLSLEKQRFLLRAWLDQLSVPIPPMTKLLQIQKILNAKKDKLPHIFWANHELRRFQDDLYVMQRLKSHDAKTVFDWRITEPFMLPHHIQLHAVLTKNQGIAARYTTLQIRFRQGGERCHLPGRKIHHELKKLMQVWKIPPWERDRIPLIFLDNQLIAVVGYFIDENYSAKEGEEGYQIMTHHDSSHF